MANPISTNQLKPGDTALVRGNLTYGRLINKIEGEELIKRNMKQKYPIKTPYTTASICNAHVVAADPQNPTLFEQWIQNGFYTSKAEGATGYSFSANNKGNSTPWIGQEVNQGKVEQVYPEGELANGLEVTLALRVFATSQNNGVSLEGVIVHEPIKLYSPNSPESVLNAHGYQFVAKPAPVKEEDVTQTEDYDENAQMYENGQTDGGTAQMPDNPYGGQQNQQAVQQPIQQAQQQQTQPPQQPPSNPLGKGNNNQNNNNQGGIRFNPESRGY